MEENETDTAGAAAAAAAATTEATTVATTAQQPTPQFALKQLIYPQPTAAFESDFIARESESSSGSESWFPIEGEGRVEENPVDEGNDGRGSWE